MSPNYQLALLSFISSLRHADENSAEHEEMQNLERNRRTVSETLRHKNRIVNELEDDLHLKEQTLIAHNEMLLRTQAIIDEQNSKRLTVSLGVFILTYLTIF